VKLQGMGSWFWPGRGSDVFHLSDVATLAHNLAVAGALFTVRRDLMGIEYSRKYWRPGEGRPHPMFEAPDSGAGE